MDAAWKFRIAAQTRPRAACAGRLAPCASGFPHPENSLIWRHSYVWHNALIWPIRYQIGLLFAETPFGASVNQSLRTLRHEATCSQIVAGIGLSGLPSRIGALALAIISVVGSEKLLPKIFLWEFANFAFPFFVGATVYHWRRSWGRYAPVKRSFVFRNRSSNGNPVVGMGRGTGAGPQIPQAKCKTMTCPICHKDTDPKYRPFCSKRCADVDLGRWLTGAYAIAADESAPEPDEPPVPPRRPH